MKLISGLKVKNDRPNIMDPSYGCVCMGDLPIL